MGRDNVAVNLRIVQDIAMVPEFAVAAAPSPSMHHPNCTSMQAHCRIAINKTKQSTCR